MLIAPNPHLRAIRRDDDRMAERSRYVCLDRNERVTPLSHEQFAAVMTAVTPQHLSAYPDPSPASERLSRHLGFPTHQICLTNGSDAAIRKVFQAFVGPGDRVLIARPTYAMYQIYSEMFQGKIESVDYDDQRRLDLERLASVLKTGPRLMALANPDQPTGGVLPLAAIRELVEIANRQGTLCLIDEAYHPFYPNTALPLVRDFANVVVTRTFSKSEGLAGLRVGYMVASPEIIDAVSRIRGAHEVSGVSIAVASYMLDHPELGDGHVAEIAAGRKVLQAVARELNIGTPDCQTNFQLLELPPGQDSSELVQRLKASGYLVRGGFAEPSVRRCLRVTLAGPEVMAGFAEALRSAIHGGERP